MTNLGPTELLVIIPAIAFVVAVIAGVVFVLRLAMRGKKGQ
ncbi:hypothetical protein [Acrocarpospora macrocephala]|nr:hypothetical protein [Acrocarpospora macrocephala]